MFVLNVDCICVCECLSVRESLLNVCVCECLSVCVRVRKYVGRICVSSSSYDTHDMYPPPHMTICWYVYVGSRKWKHPMATVCICAYCLYVSSSSYYIYVCILLLVSHTTVYLYLLSLSYGMYPPPHMTCICTYCPTKRDVYITTKSTMM
jgi:hypothetical protein